MATSLTGLLGRGEFTRAVLFLSKSQGSPVRLPRDLSVFFPNADGRQDLMYEQEFGLAPYRGEFTEARALVERAGLSADQESLLLGYLDLFLGEYERAAGLLERVAGEGKGYWPHFLHA